MLFQTQWYATLADMKRFHAEEISITMQCSQYFSSGLRNHALICVYVKANVLHWDKQKKSAQNCTKITHWDF